MTDPVRDPPPIAASAIDHVAVAVPDLDRAVTFFLEHFGAKASEPKTVPEQGIRLAYVHFGNAKIELMQPLDDDSPVGRFIARNPAGGLHHISFAAADAEAAHSAAAARGLRPLNKPVEGHHGRPLFFLHPKAAFGALFEIEEISTGGARDSD